jgi:hypothetical protein
MRCLPSKLLPLTRRTSILRSILLPTFAVPREVSGQPTLMGRPSHHPNAIKNGFDDGFVLSADADTGDAKWLAAYPKSNKDAQTAGVDIDAAGNV